MEVNKIIQSAEELPLQKEALINLILSAQLVHDSYNKIFKKFNLSQQQFNVLRILRGQKGKPANLKCIQERMITKMSNTTRLIDKLIEKGFVERHICTDNRREIEVFITANGLTILEEVSPILEQQERQLTGSLTTKEMENLNLILNKLRTHE
ncbi:MAG: MarR family winged helix-turn-helix transcriptional regulator [Flavobacteriaceae bacterium]|nr:MarR family transcriptional regulator [Psychroflexus sp.]